MSAWLEPQALLALSRRAREEAEDAFAPGDVDMSRPFIHEEFTQLFHTPLYAELDDATRLRYNQLSGMSSNELFMMFETGFTNRVIRRVLNHRMMKRDPVLRECLKIMLEEEKVHTEMFAALNRRCHPGIYSHRRFYFTRPGLFDALALWVLTHVPQHLLLVLWLVMIMEEFSNYISRRTIHDPRSDTLGELEPAFVELHQRHLRDEARHVQIDANLIDRLLAQAGGFKRRSNARILRYLMDQILTPRRAGVAVIRHLVGEQARLRDQEAGMLAALRSLGSEPGFARALRAEREMKLTRLFMERFAEYRFIDAYAR